MKKNQGITFITPAYNCAKTVNETVESVFRIFMPGDEYVIVNDGSTDKTEETIRKLSKRYPIKIINHKRNTGGAEARNTAVINAANERIFCLDADNLVDVKSFIKMRNFSDKIPDKNLFFEELHYFKTVCGIKIYTHNWVFKKEKYTINEYLNCKIVPGASGNYLFTKKSWSKVGGYPTKSGALDTWGFGFYQTLFGFDQYKVDKTFYNHRYGTNSYYVRDSKKAQELETKRMIVVNKYINKIPQKYEKKIKKLGVLWFGSLNECVS